MRPSWLFSVLCFAAFPTVIRVAAQSGQASILFLYKETPSAARASQESSTNIPPLLRAPISLYEVQQQILSVYLHPLSRCYVIESCQFTQAGSNFNPAVPTTRSVCQPASQLHLKGAMAGLK